MLSENASHSLAGRSPLRPPGLPAAHLTEGEREPHMEGRCQVSTKVEANPTEPGEQNRPLAANFFCEPQDLPGRMEAARPVTWRAQSEPLQTQWTHNEAAPTLLIELWAGMSGLAMALISLGVRPISPPPK